MKALRRVLFLLAIFCWMCIQTASLPEKANAAEGDEAWGYWRAYTSDSHVGFLAFDGINVWAGSSGGVIHWNASTHSPTKYTRLDAHAGLDRTPIAIDAAGNKWFASCDGLVKFDGHLWTTYPTSNNCYSAIAIDHDGNKWLGAWGNVYKFDGVGWTVFPTGDPYHGGTISAIAVDMDGNVWIGNSGGGGVYRYDHGVLTQYTTQNVDLPSNYIYSIYADSNGAIWFGSNYGVSKFDNGNWTEIVNNQIFDTILAITEGPGDVMWFGGYAGAYKLDGDALAHYTTSDGLGDNIVKSIVVDGGGNPWFATNAGISILSTGVWTILDTPVRLGTNSIHAIAAAEDGSIWFGLESSGVTKYDGENWLNYTNADGLATNSILSLAIDSAGNLWADGQGEGVSIFDGDHWTIYNDSNGLPNDYVDAIAADHSGNVWVGTSSGLIRYNGSTWSYMNDPDVTNPDLRRVKAIGIDLDNHVWIATGGNSSYGLAEFDGTAWTWYDTSDGLISNRVQTIACAPNGAMWFGTNLGVSRFYTGEWTSFDVTDGLPGPNVHVIQADLDGNIWVATNDGSYEYYGVSKFDGVAWQSYSTADGLIDHDVYAIAIDHAGNKWFGTYAGASELIKPLKVFLPNLRKAP